MPGCGRLVGMQCDRAPRVLLLRLLLLWWLLLRLLLWLLLLLLQSMQGRRELCGLRSLLVRM